MSSTDKKSEKTDMFGRVQIRDEAWGIPHGLGRFLLACEIPILNMRWIGNTLKLIMMTKDVFDEQKNLKKLIFFEGSKSVKNQGVYLMVWVDFCPLFKVHFHIEIDRKYCETNYPD